jgi:hypothetical protein
MIARVFSGGSTVRPVADASAFHQQNPMSPARKPLSQSDASAHSILRSTDSSPTPAAASHHRHTPSLLKMLGFHRSGRKRMTSYDPEAFRAEPLPTAAASVYSTDDHNRSFNNLKVHEEPPRKVCRRRRIAKP